jgi:NAD dependent epimerase/dehydratase family enzyme
VQAKDQVRKRTIITGGTGLIGPALAAELVAYRHDVTVLSRSPVRVSGLPQGVEVQGWDDGPQLAGERCSKTPWQSSTLRTRT